MSFISAAVGGPKAWSGHSLEHIHYSLNINESQFDRYVNFFVEAAEEVGKVEEGEKLRVVLYKFKPKVSIDKDLLTPE